MKTKKTQLQVYMVSIKADYIAAGIFDGNGILLLKGSLVSKHVTRKNSNIAKREQLLGEDCRLKEDEEGESL